MSHKFAKKIRKAIKYKQKQFNADLVSYLRSLSFWARCRVALNIILRRLKI